MNQLQMFETEARKGISEENKKWFTIEEWESMDNLTKTCHLSARGKTKFNKTNDNVEWARWTWNPITGCLHNCEYCYARDIANRFYSYGFQPAFLPSRLNAPGNTRSPNFTRIDDPVERLGQRNVFVCSMADLFGKWVPDDWITAVLSAIENNPQWTFLLLSKFPVRMADFSYPENVWLGTTVDYQHAVKRAESAFYKIKDSGFTGVCWLSCEPLMENLEFTSLAMFDWLVMGGASKSSQSDMFTPSFQWIVDLYNQAKTLSIPVYQKTNLIPGMSDEQRVREYPV